MTKGRLLSVRESILVETMKEQARIMAEIIRLETRTRPAYRTPAADERLADLRAELSAIKNSMNTNDRQERAHALSIAQDSPEHN